MPVPRCMTHSVWPEWHFPMLFWESFTPWLIRQAPHTPAATSFMAVQTQCICQEAAGELVISYGTDRVIDQTAQTLTWEDNGQFYTLLGFDVEMTPEEFYQMAGEIIDAE